MKYIKQFEDRWIENFQIGDYVKLEDSNIKSWFMPTPQLPNGYKIFNFAQIVGNNTEDDFFNLKFEIIADDKLNVLYDNKNIIERKLTPKEIEEYEAKKLSIKYNI